jgi:UDP-glucose 4-epimerase
MKAAVLGVNGYLGQHVALDLLQRGWQVGGYGSGAAPGLPGLEYTRMDLRNKEELQQLDPGVDVLFYFAGLTGTARAYDEYEHYIDVNEKGLLHVLDRMRQSHQRARIVFPSTRLVYKGVKNTPLAEDAGKEWKTIYALNKWFGENAVRQYGDYFDLPYTIFRICVPYGDLIGRPSSYGTVGFFLKRAVEGNNISLYGTGDQQRSFTHVGDLCDQIYRTLQKPESVNGTFNIAGETYSLRQIADAVARKYSVGVDLVEWPTLDRKLESGDTIFDSARIEKLIGPPLKNNFMSWLETIA